MAPEGEWESRVKGMLKGELKRRNVTYDQLAERLQAMGVRETTASITNKVSRGRFTAVFLVQCMDAIGCDALRLR